MLRASVFFTLLCSVFAGPAHASTDCGVEKSHVEYRECLKSRASQSRVELEQALALLAKRIDGWIEELEYRQRARAYLQQSYACILSSRDLSY